MEDFIIKNLKQKEIIYELYYFSSLTLSYSSFLSKGGFKKGQIGPESNIRSEANPSFCFRLNYWNQYTINIQFISMLGPIILNRDKLNRGEKGK